MTAHKTTMEPDDLYTLRAQYWLGHYQMALDEAKSLSRRPMSPNLKAEREEWQARASIALGLPVANTATDGKYCDIHRKLRSFVSHPFYDSTPSHSAVG